ncbi:MAG TPA: glycosyltransferase [Candidatus Deferrimicrobiaceae bacterium]|nr:glycosyltransferase [Candidatus Deferrimicrobiaceae bacterium]
MKVLLVAKPWRGGLASYVFRALQDLFPGEVQWWATRPLHAAERLDFLRNREAWYGGLKERLVSAEAEAMVFINHLKMFDELPPHPRKVLWLTDDPKPRAGELSPYDRIYLSDPGYADEVTAIVGDRYGGEIPFGYCPTVHVPAPPAARRNDVCFIGNRDPKRDRYLASLLERGFRPTVVGNYFLRHRLFWRYPGCFRPAVPNDRMGRVYAGHRLSLNVHAEVLRQGTNMRTFECAAYGIPQLVEYRPGIERFFTPGEEIATFSDEAEMLDRLSRLLSEPSQAAVLAANARRRALREHSYHRRAISLLEGVLPPDLLRNRLTAVEGRLTIPGVAR